MNKNIYSEIDKNLERLKSYKCYLNTIQHLLNRYFEEQKDYICCKKGCSHCCEKGIYPYSELEYMYLALGFMKLPQNIQLEILNRIAQVKADYLNSKTDGKNFVHRCPFLSEGGECCVYDFRGLICRNFGIMAINTKNEISMPFCVDFGLNYSNVYDKNTKKFDFDLVEKEGFSHPPRPYPITRASLMDKDIFSGEPLDFGETKALIDWL